MGSRNHLCKNPSLSYKKDLSLSSVLQNLNAYNLATGNPPLTQDVKPPNEDKKPNQKRRRIEKPLPEIEVNDGPMSHQDYVDKRRQELSACRSYEKFQEDILTGSSTLLNLVDYGSDESASSESEEKEDRSSSAHSDEFVQVRNKIEQSYPDPGDPVCVMCGKYGEYICDETDDDICGLECKAKLLQSLRLAEHKTDHQKADIQSSGLKGGLLMPDVVADTWDYNHHRWSKKRSNLCTYECWKCLRPGHLAEDCLVTTKNQVEVGQDKTNAISRDLVGLYKRCHQIGRNLSAANCNVCRSSLGLATCIDCNTVICDESGHLHEHVRTHPSHKQYYSHKLKRLVKCCKSTCKVTNIKDLLACHYCFDKAFDKCYDMYTATWKRAGLSIIWGSICCEDHFEWHRMNCLSAGIEENAYLVNNNSEKDKCVQISDFIF